MWIARRFEEDLLVGYKVKEIVGFALFFPSIFDFLPNGTCIKCSWVNLTPLQVKMTARVSVLVSISRVYT